MARAEDQQLHRAKAQLLESATLLQALLDAEAYEDLTADEQRHLAYLTSLRDQMVALLDDYLAGV